VDEAVTVARAAADGEQGELRIGYAPFITMEIVPRALRLFQEEHPNVQVKLCDLSTQEMARGLREHTLDLALLVVDLSAKFLPNCEFVELRRYSVCVAVSPDHRLARTGKIGVPGLLAEQLIAFSRDEYPEYHSWLHEQFSLVGRSPAIAEEHDSAPSLLAAVEAGRGVALVLEPFKSFVGSRVKLVPFSVPPVIVGVAFFNSPTNSRPKHVEHFLAAAKRVCSGAVDEVCSGSKLTIRKSKRRILKPIAPANAGSSSPRV
jgi:DNA-binding transcriptional LysR family regulator